MWSVAPSDACVPRLRTPSTCPFRPGGPTPGAVRKLSILLPHSRGTAEGGTGGPWSPGRSSLPELDEHRARVVDAAGLGGAPTRRTIDRFSGVLYRELDYPSLDEAARRRARSNVLIVNGLLGVSAPGDPMPDHRLGPGDTLDPLGRLATWWRPRLTPVLARHLKGAVVWDLLPGEHSAAWTPAEVPSHRRITVRFLDASGRTVSHWNKLLKGALVRHVLATRLLDPAGLADFEHPAGYRLDAAASTLTGDRPQVVLRAD